MSNPLTAHGLPACPCASDCLCRSPLLSLIFSIIILIVVLVIPGKR